MGFLAGFLPAAVGSGAGFFIQISMYSMGLNPKEVISSSNLIVFLSGLTTVIMFSVQGLLLGDYLLVIVVLTVAGAITGITLQDLIIKRFQRPSLIVLMTFIIVGSF